MTEKSKEIEVYLKCDKCSYAAAEKKNRLITVNKANDKEYEIECGLEAIGQWNEAINLQQERYLP